MKSKLNNLQAGRTVMGFTDVYFCPLLANDLALIFLQMLELGLSGLYHVVSSECLSKYAFGVRIARRFGQCPLVGGPGVDARQPVHQARP